MPRRASATDRPWFVRVKSGGRCDLRPASGTGWLITLFYVAAVAGISLFFLARGGPSTAEIVAWATLMAATTFLYILTAWRTAAIVSREGGGRGTRRTPGAEAARTLLIAAATAAAIIGAAFLGVEF